tara:strand:+ start:345 stop:461 length:117 start_codon:yes stop_codon:yes gene_type:complete
MEGSLFALFLQEAAKIRVKMQTNEEIFMIERLLIEMTK